VIELEKDPDPDPSTVLGSAVVGEPVVFQQTPLADTKPPPSLVTVPPPDAVVPVLFVIVLVTTVGTVRVVKD
jgi:hypothetical protein